jgi:hypothetical protein
MVWGSGSTKDKRQGFYLTLRQQVPQGSRAGSRGSAGVAASGLEVDPAVLRYQPRHGEARGAVHR